MSSPPPFSLSSLSLLWGSARSLLYDRAIPSFTSRWYHALLLSLPDNAHLLDVGIGTGTALLSHASLLRSKNLIITGLDRDAGYIRRCTSHIHRLDLSSHVRALHADITTWSGPSSGRLFDAVFFSGSLMLMEDPCSVLRSAWEWLRDREEGRIWVAQTFELRKNVVLEWVKPRLGGVTTIDFGAVTYEGDFEEAVEGGGGCIVGWERVKDGKTIEGVREARLVCLRSKLYVEKETETVE